MSLTYLDRGEAKSGTQWEVVSGRLAIGSIRKNTLSVVANRRVTWEWTLSVLAAPPGFEHHGRSETLEQAKERNWRMWCEAAGLKE